MYGVVEDGLLVVGLRDVHVELRASAAAPELPPRRLLSAFCLATWFGLGSGSTGQGEGEGECRSGWGQDERHGQVSVRVRVRVRVRLGLGFAARDIAGARAGRRGISRTWLRACAGARARATPQRAPRARRRPRDPRTRAAGGGATPRARAPRAQASHPSAGRATSAAPARRAARRRVAARASPRRRRRRRLDDDGCVVAVLAWYPDAQVGPALAAASELALERLVVTAGERARQLARRDRTSRCARRCSRLAERR